MADAQTPESKNIQIEETKRDEETKITSQTRSQVLIITPEQIEKLGLASRIKNVVESQITSKNNSKEQGKKAKKSLKERPAEGMKKSTTKKAADTEITVPTTKKFVGGRISKRNQEKVESFSKSKNKLKTKLNVTSADNVNVGKHTPKHRRVKTALNLKEHAEITDEESLDLDDPVLSESPLLSSMKNKLFELLKNQPTEPTSSLTEFSKKGKSVGRRRKAPTSVDDLDHLPVKKQKNSGKKQIIPKEGKSTDVIAAHDEDATTTSKTINNKSRKSLKDQLQTSEAKKTAPSILKAAKSSIKKKSTHSKIEIISNTPINLDSVQLKKMLTTASKKMSHSLITPQNYSTAVAAEESKNETLDASATTIVEGSNTEINNENHVLNTDNVSEMDLLNVNVKKSARTAISNKNHTTKHQTSCSEPLVNFDPKIEKCTSNISIKEQGDCKDINNKNLDIIIDNNDALPLSQAIKSPTLLKTHEHTKLSESEINKSDSKNLPKKRGRRRIIQENLNDDLSLSQVVESPSLSKTSQHTKLNESELIKSDSKSLPKKRERKNKDPKKKDSVTNIQDIKDDDLPLSKVVDSPSAIITSQHTKLSELELNKSDSKNLPKKRGRRKKNLEKVETDANIQENVINDDLPLSQVVESSSLSKTSQHIELSESELNKSVTENLPKKRGRKKKSLIKEDNEANIRDTKLKSIEEQEQDKSDQRSNRRCNRIDYAALSEGIKADKKAKQKLTKVVMNNGINELQFSHHNISGSDENQIMNVAKKKPYPEKTPEEEFSLSVENVKKRRGKNTKYKVRKEPNKDEGTRKVVNMLFTHLNATSSLNSLNNGSGTGIILDTSLKVDDKLPSQSGSHGASDLASESDSAVQELPSDNKQVVCAVCGHSMAKSAAWVHHKQRYHNNLAWRVGDKPLDLNDQGLVVNILTNLYKTKKRLYCDKCGVTKKSVMGFLSHKASCLKSAEEIDALKISCEICGKKVLPVSMYTHIRLSHQQIKSKNTVVKDEDLRDSSPGDEGRATEKRKAASKAKNLISDIAKDKLMMEQDYTKSRKSLKRYWHENFDFHETHLIKVFFKAELKKNKAVKCLFEGCNFQSTDLTEICYHISQCNRKPLRGFTCKYCIITYETEKEVMDHVLERHVKTSKDTEVVIDECDADYDTESHSDKHVLKSDSNAIGQRARKIKFVLETKQLVNRLGTQPVFYFPAYDWALKFCQKNFTTPNLFPRLSVSHKNWTAMDPDSISKYLPRIMRSVCTARLQVQDFINPLARDYEWKEYMLFETNILENGDSTVFCGGPIHAMAWLPTPFNHSCQEQILAVSTIANPDRNYYLNRMYTERNLIQFWNYGPLHNEQCSTYKPTLEFCIAHSYGGIWCMEWCPSGCYDVNDADNSSNLRRMGLLCIACSDSFAYIYSVCFPNQLSEKVFRPKPILKLMMENVTDKKIGKWDYQCTKISWTKAKGHRYLATGYSNGMVAIFDLDTKSRLLKLGADKNGIECILPFRLIPAHHHAVTALNLYHLNNGQRWLLTGSYDRSINFWDIDKPNLPITNIDKFVVTDGVWLNHWLCSVHCYDDCSAPGQTYTSVNQVRNFGSSIASLLFSSSRVCSISGSEWTNGYIQGNAAGEISATFPSQLFYAMDSKSFKNKRWMLGYAGLVEKAVSIEERLEEEHLKLQAMANSIKYDSYLPLASEENSLEVEKRIIFDKNPHYYKYEPKTYKEADEKYGLVFCDMKMDSLKDFPEDMMKNIARNKSEKFYETRPNVYPMQSINKIAFNPNNESFAYIACGYQAGFVRVFCLRFLPGHQTHSTSQNSYWS